MVQCPQDMAPPLTHGDRKAVMLNHAEAGANYAACRNNHRALIDTLCAQRGVTINGMDPGKACVSH